jgi:hypothetical protein
VILTAVLIAALVLALIDQARAKGESLTDWSLIIVIVVLLWLRLA